jgi:putative ABC transport system substrate-binding protein
MRRRDFLLAIGGALATYPRTAHPQGRVRRIGFLSAFAEQDPETKVRVAIFLKRLESLGWRPGANIEIEYRYAYGDAGRVQAAVKEMVALAPEVIVTMSNPVIAALLRETRSVPIVFGQVADPVGSGFVATLASPGGNATGFANLEPSIGGKWAEILKEAAPSVTRALALHHAQTAANLSFVRASEAAARQLGMTITPAAVNNPAEIERSVTAFAGEPNGGLIAMPHPVTVSARFLIAELAIRHRLPSVGAFRYIATAGSLLSYGNEGSDLFGSAADYVDRILRGTRPGELPVQTPTKFELFVNLNTAKALGLTVPQSLLARADELIE